MSKQKETSAELDADPQGRLEALVRPRRGWMLGRGRLVVHANMARTWTWEHDTNKGVRHTDFLAITKVRDGRGNNALSIIAGPFLIVIGWA